MVRPTHAVVDLVGLTHNYHAIERHVTAGSRPTPPRIIAVVKANAYGHGAIPVARALEQAAAGGGAELILACAEIEEGVELRSGGITAPILVFGALSVIDLEGVFASDLVPTVSSPWAARALEQAAAARGHTLHVHLKIDTGMNRFGFRHDNLAQTLPEVLGAAHLVVDAVYTHFATADRDDHPLFAQQIERFETVRATRDALGLGAVWWHAANSAAIVRDERTWYDAVRPGRLLYGIAPTDQPPAIALQPVLSLRSRVVTVKGMRPDETVGYDAQYRASRAMEVAVIPAGYADGLDLRLAGRGEVLVGGQRAPILTISMDSAVIDVTSLSVRPGDDVVMFGAQGDARIDAREIAATIDTVPLEVLCRVGSRIERTYTLTPD